MEKETANKIRNDLTLECITSITENTDLSVEDSAELTKEIKQAVESAVLGFEPTDTD